MNNVNLFLTDDATDWTEINMNAVRFLNEKKFTEKTIFIFKILFQKRFSVKIVKSSTVNFYTEFEKFRQKTNESINAYHKRTLNFGSKIAVRNRFIDKQFFFLKKITLKKIIKTFVKKLHDDNVKKKSFVNWSFLFVRCVNSLSQQKTQIDSKKKWKKSWKKKSIDEIEILSKLHYKIYIKKTNEFHVDYLSNKHESNLFWWFHESFHDNFINDYFCFYARFDFCFVVNFDFIFNFNFNLI